MPSARRTGAVAYTPLERSLVPGPRRPVRSESYEKPNETPNGCAAPLKRQKRVGLPGGPVQRPLSPSIPFACSLDCTGTAPVRNPEANGTILCKVRVQLSGGVGYV